MKFLIKIFNLKQKKVKETKNMPENQTRKYQYSNREKFTI